MEMKGYRIERILKAQRTTKGTLAVFIEKQDREQAVLELTTERAEELASLLQAALSRSRPDRPDAPPLSAFPASGRSPSRESAQASRRIRVASRPTPSTRGSFVVRLENEQGQAMTFDFSHEEVLEWHAALGAEIAKFKATMS